VLVLPKRVVPRITDLDADEVSDLFLAVQSVGKAVEKAYGAEALTVSVQVGRPRVFDHWDYAMGLKTPGRCRGGAERTARSCACLTAVQD
jgi:bis(5'-adenosyl)-triphosphatase